MTNSDLFLTSDLSLSSALLCKGFTLESVKKLQPKSQFLFYKSEKLDETIKDFWAGKLAVEPKSYFNCLKEIKSRLYQN